MENTLLLKISFKLISGWGSQLSQIKLLIQPPLMTCKQLYAFVGFSVLKPQFASWSTHIPHALLFTTWSFSMWRSYGGSFILAFYAASRRSRSLNRTLCLFPASGYYTSSRQNYLGSIFKVSSTLRLNDFRKPCKRFIFLFNSKQFTSRRNSMWRNI